MDLSDNHIVPSRCRTIIVGAGLAGMEIAKELERLGVREVLVLEAGPADDLRHVNVAHNSKQALRKWLEPETDDFFRQPWTSRTRPHYTGTSGIRQRLGGRSLYWHGVALPIESWALAQPWWPSRVIADLRDSWKGAASLYTRIERQLIDWRGDVESTTLADESVIGSVGAFDLRATPRAVKQSSLDSDRWYSYSPLDHWRDPETGEVRRSPVGIQICTNVEVVKVAVSDWAAHGVVVRRGGQNIEIASDIVVLAAGTLENSRLAVQALTEVDAMSEPRLTKLADHIVHGVLVRLETPQADRLLSFLAPGSYFAACPTARSNLFLDLTAASGGQVLVDLQLTGEQMPSGNSMISCQPTSSFPWSMAIATATSPDDMVVIDAQREILRQVWAGLAATSGCPSAILEFTNYNQPGRTYALVLSNSLWTGPPGVPATWSNFLGTEDHEGGTLALGGLLNEDHQFLALPGLFAAGPSTFPRLGAANPGLTILALAHRLATQLAGKA